MIYVMKGRRSMYIRCDNCDRYLTLLPIIRIVNTDDANQ